MTYRIRYIPADGGEQCITTVEANTPSEAVVKFSVCRQDATLPGRSHQVTSVVAEEFALPALT